jgi:hypothetical protein
MDMLCIYLSELLRLMDTELAHAKVRVTMYMTTHGEVNCA